MILLTDAIRKALPPLYATERVADPVAICKFFLCTWTWYALEFDGEDEFFGLVIGFEAELGYFSLSELEAVRGPGGLPVERDLYFTPTPLSEIRRREECRQ